MRKDVQLEPPLPFKGARRQGPAARHPKFSGIHEDFCTVCIIGEPRHVFGLVSRSLFCARSCPCSPQKTRFFEKSSDQRINKSELLSEGRVCSGCLTVFRARKNEGNKLQKPHADKKRLKIGIINSPQHALLNKPPNFSPACTGTHASIRHFFKNVCFYP